MDDLCDLGETCCPNRVARLARLAGIYAQIGYKRRPGKYGGKPSVVVDNSRMKKDLAIRALDMAVALRQPPKDCIHHTDRGSQYCSNEYQRRLSKHGFKVSMSGKGNCYDNSMLETFFKSITLGTLLRNTLPRNARLS